MDTNSAKSVEVLRDAEGGLRANISTRQKHTAGTDALCDARRHADSFASQLHQGESVFKAEPSEAMNHYCTTINMRMYIIHIPRTTSCFHSCPKEE